MQICPIPGVTLQAGDLMAATDKFWITFAGRPVPFGPSCALQQRRLGAFCKSSL